QASWLGVVPAAELRRLRLPFVPRFLQDRRDLGVGDEALPALRVPVEEHPDPVFLVGIAKDGRTLRPVLLSLLGALGREDLLEAVEVLDLRRCQDHLLLLLWCRPRRRGSSRWRGECVLPRDSFQSRGPAERSCHAPSMSTGRAANEHTGSRALNRRPS